MPNAHTYMYSTGLLRVPCCPMFLALQLTNTPPSTSTTRSTHVLFMSLKLLLHVVLSEGSGY
jgi:hypothetical protein